MLILTINTINRDISILLQNDNMLIDEISIKDKNQHAELLLFNIEKILNNNKLWYNDINCFSVINGPGSFIGLKVSIAAIKAIKTILPDKLIITNNVFEILSFKKKYNFIILKADYSGCYMCNKNNEMIYIKNDDIIDFLNAQSSRKNIIITNDKKLVDFLKINNILYSEINIGDIVLLNYYKYTNNFFSTNIVPLYIREPQINKKNE